MLEIVEQMEPHTYMKKYSIKNIQTFKKYYIHSVKEYHSEAILKELETSMFKFFMEL